MAIRSNVVTLSFSISSLSGPVGILHVLYVARESHLSAVRTADPLFAGTGAMMVMDFKNTGFSSRVFVFRDQRRVFWFARAPGRPP